MSLSDLADSFLKLSQQLNLLLQPTYKILSPILKSLAPTEQANLFSNAEQADPILPRPNVIKNTAIKLHYIFAKFSNPRMSFRPVNSSKVSETKYQFDIAVQYTDDDNNEVDDSTPKGIELEDSVMDVAMYAVNKLMGSPKKVVNKSLISYDNFGGQHKYQEPAEAIWEEVGMDASSFRVTLRAVYETSHELIGNSLSRPSNIELPTSYVDGMKLTIEAL